ncbi:hypothetical protein PVNG_05542 [Plasmodium vivax North Korean]|uniref:Uncharacterized protein n=2 Tax=Plasmodium vivax TaxID=5855 RepID=A0A0J9TZV2_PLAVI|nr:hypothetical protein PVNG_05542 [Plasmodium vivax North Korean]
MTQHFYNTIRFLLTVRELLTYKRYFNLKERFSKDYEKNVGLNPKDLLDNEKFNNWNKGTFRTILEEFLRHLRNHGVFWHNEDEACRYISYILSKDVQTKGYEYKPETFKMFQEFVDTYNSSHKYQSKNCSTSLVYVHSNIYDKMYKLYELYELFNNFPKKNIFWQVTSCSPIRSFLHSYNYFIKNNQPSNTHYKYILDEFRKEIQNQVESYNIHKCPGKYIHVEDIIFTDLSKNKEPEPPVLREQQQNHAEYQESKANSPPPHVQHQATREEPQTSRAVPEIPHEHPQLPHKETQLFQETLASNAYPAVRQEVPRPPHGEIYKQELHGDLSQVNLTYSGSLESLPTSSYSETNPYLSVVPPSNEVGDTSSSVMSTITSALRDVEPGPVLGVSGGMGVLFLLFKVFNVLKIYTYVYNTLK